MEGFDAKIIAVFLLSLGFLGASYFAVSRSVANIDKSDVATLVRDDSGVSLVFREREGAWLKGLAGTAWMKILVFATAHNPAGDIFPDWLDDEVRAFVKKIVN